ncbi:hypothetical protein N9L02_00025 [Gammaproteobacteria bacterium]|nr:hypothetical protein [Gammaproteobacteria bacterium]
MVRTRDHLKLSIHSNKIFSSSFIFDKQSSFAKIKATLENTREDSCRLYLHILLRDTGLNGMLAVDFGYRKSNVNIIASSTIALIDSLAESSSFNKSNLKWHIINKNNFEIAAKKLKIYNNSYNTRLCSKSLTSAIFKSIRSEIIGFSDDEFHVSIIQPTVQQELYGKDKFFYDNLGYLTLHKYKKNAHKYLPKFFISSFSSFFKSSGSEIKADKILIDQYDLNCPIGKVLMRDPVLAHDGYHYEAGQMQLYLNQFKGTGSHPISPVDRTVINYDYIKDRLLRDHIHDRVLNSYDLAKEFAEAHPEAIINPKLILSEIDFAEKFRQIYPSIIAKYNILRPV